MRAAVLRAYNQDLSIETVPDPVCPADGVVLKVLACGICRSDWHGWVGEHPKVQPGAIPGHEYCGEVVAAGPLARWSRGRPGDRALHPVLRRMSGMPVGPEHDLPRPDRAGVRRAGGLCGVHRGAARPQPCAPARDALAGAGGGTGLPGDDGLARADGPRGVAGGRVAGGARHRRGGAVGADPGPGARCAGRGGRCGARAAGPRAVARGRGGGGRARRATSRRGSSRSPAAARMSASRRLASRPPSTPRSSACARWGGMCRSGCRRATWHGWRST